MRNASKEVTNEKVAVELTAFVEELIQEKSITREELGRRVKEYIFSNPLRLLGLAIKAQRKAGNMTRKQLATRASLPLRTLTTLERGSLPDLSVAALLDIANALGVSVDCILCKSGWPGCDSEQLNHTPVQDLPARKAPSTW